MYELLNMFDNLMSHLNGEENDMAEEFKQALIAAAAKGVLTNE